MTSTIGFTVFLTNKYGERRVQYSIIISIITTTINIIINNTYTRTSTATLSVTFATISPSLSPYHHHYHYHYHYYQYTVGQPQSLTTPCLLDGTTNGALEHSLTSWLTHLLTRQPTQEARFHNSSDQQV
jgi:hypothetical protein